ncbi:MAG TPA: dTMP kinase [Acidimicrobiia bacterium]|nr:dTMP kinase [Acidimicrobiia bacterium]
MTVRYVAFEGIDGAGKSTVCRRVADGLEAAGWRTMVVREPGGTDVGEALRSVLLDHPGHVDDWAEALLFAAARAQLVTELVGPALAEGRTVLSDRSVYSSLAYQGGGRGLGIDLVRQVNEVGLRGVWPEVVVLLRLEPESGLEREDGADRISSEGIALQQRVAAAYDALAAEESERFVIVDARDPLDDVVEAVLAELERRW